MPRSPGPRGDSAGNRAVKVRIANDQQVLPLDHGWFRELVRHVCGAEGVAAARIGLAFLTNDAMHRLNVRHLQHDYPTDVLTFPMGGGRVLEAEIAVGAEYALSECAEYGWSAHLEASLYVTHGLLHLMGYDDHDDAKKARMEARQQQLLEEFARGRAYQPQQDPPGPEAEAP